MKHTRACKQEMRSLPPTQLRHLVRLPSPPLRPLSSNRSANIRCCLAQFGQDHRKSDRLDGSVRSMPDARLHIRRHSVREDDVYGLLSTIAVSPGRPLTSLTSSNTESSSALPSRLISVSTNVTSANTLESACSFSRCTSVPHSVSCVSEMTSRSQRQTDGQTHHKPPVYPDQGALIRPCLDLLAQAEEHRVHIGRQERDHLKHVGARLVHGTLRPRRHPVVFGQFEE